ncbi:MAG: hypothetical protein BV459_08185, partial [Thermoplasmata archaeon M11B2D]
MESVDILITHAEELLTLKGPKKPRIRQQMKNLGIIKNGSIAIKNGIIVDVGKHLRYKTDIIIDA